MNLRKSSQIPKLRGDRALQEGVQTIVQRVNGIQLTYKSADGSREEILWKYESLQISKLRQVKFLGYGPRERRIGEIQGSKVFPLCNFRWNGSRDHGISNREIRHVG